MSKTKKQLTKKLMNSSLGSLVERQGTFKYDDEGVKKPGHFWENKAPQKDPLRKADLQHRVNDFYQKCRGSDVAYITTQTKNTGTMLWSTSPTRLLNRGETLKKDITMQPKAQKKSKIFSGYDFAKQEDQSVLFSSKVASPRGKNEKFVPVLQRILLDRSLNTTSKDIDLGEGFE